MIHNNLIGGQWLAGASSTANLNPSDLSDTVGQYARADAEQCRQAIAAAVDAYRTWSVSNIQQRSDILDRVGMELLARQEELGALLSREEGKTLAEGIGEVTRAGRIFKFFAAECLRPAGELVESVRTGINVEVTREPLGVVGIITPWNFPIAIPAWKIAPALAYGNTVVFKPAELVPACAWALADILHRAGTPPGVFNLVMSRGAVMGPALLDSDQVAGISFTGSVETGRTLAATAASRFIKLQLEMGGKNPLVVLDDADLDVAVNVAIQGSYFSTGQRCTASSRLIVTRGIHDRFVAAMVERIRTLNIGHALRPATEIGPVVDQSQLEQDLDYIELGRKEGAQLLFGGERLQRDTEGFFLQPALFTEVQPTMRIAREEIFGPIASVIRVADYDEALACANDSTFGLSSGIVTTSLKHASHFKRHVQSGMVMVNCPTAGVDYHVPFGGRKHSSYGPREQGHYAREFFSTVKTAYVAP